MPDFHIPARPITITLNTVTRAADGTLRPLPEPGRVVLVYGGKHWFSARYNSGCWVPLENTARFIEPGDMWSFLPIEGPHS